LTAGVNPTLACQDGTVLLYNRLAEVPTLRPAVLASALVDALLARTKFKSFVVMTVELTKVVVPARVKLPVTVKLPPIVASPVTEIVLLKVALPVTVIVLENVAAPVILAVPVTAIELLKVELPVTEIALLKVALPVTEIVFDRAAAPVTFAVVDTTRPARTKKSLLAMSSLPSVWRFYYL